MKCSRQSKKRLRKEDRQMYESFEVVELGGAEVAIEIGFPISEEEVHLKFEPSCAPYVEFDE
jgi:hypothetical protein